MKSAERFANFIAFVKEEITLLGDGKLDRLSSNGELCAQFGYSPSSISAYLCRVGLSQERILASKSRQEHDLLTPSNQLAWILGVLSGGGNVNPINKTISVASKDEEEILDAFKTAGEEVFKVRATCKPMRNQLGEYTAIVFYTQNIPVILGDLKHAEWPRTISERHPWILEKATYRWAFIEGFFERRAVITLPSVKKANRGILFRTTHKVAADFLRDFLQDLGLRHPTVGYADKQHEQVQGVRISYLEDMKTLAAHIHSKISAKERELEIIRNYQRIHSDHQQVQLDELIEEWERISRILGHSPHIEDFKLLRRQNQTRFHYGVYIDKLGVRTFSAARTKLEKLISGNYGSLDDLTRSEDDNLTRKQNVDSDNSLLLFSLLPQEKAWEVADRYWGYVQANPDCRMDIPEYYTRIYLVEKRAEK